MFGRRVTPRRSLATAVLLGLTLTACGGGDDGSTEAEQDASAPLDIWIRKPPGSNSENTAKEIAAQFTDSTGIETNVTALFEDFETKLQQGASQGDLPDIVINDTAQLGTLVEQGLVREVNREEIEHQDELTPTAWDAATGADGNFYAVPFSAQSFALFVRSDWRDAVGLGVPQDWDELDALAKAFTTQDPDGNGKDDTYGYVVPGSTKRGYTSWYFTSFLWSAGGDFFAGDTGSFEPAISSDESVAALEWFKKAFCADQTVAPGAVTMETSQAHPVFETGSAGIYFTGPYMMARFDESLGADKYEVVPLPSGAGGPASLAEGENVYLMAGSENEAGQEKFAEFTISVEGQTIGMAGDEDGGVVRLPVNSTVDLAEVRSDERWQIFDEIYRSAGRYVPNVPEWTPFRQTAAEAFNAIVANCDSDPAAKLEELASTFADELQAQEATS